MSLLITLLARLGLPEPVRKFAAWLLIAALGLTGLALLKGCYERSVIREHEAEREVQAQAARNNAEVERVKDAQTNAANERELHHAIDAASGGELSPAAHALACQRLRKIGRIPAACRSSGSDRSQAAAE